MSLFKQISIMMSIFLFIIIASVMTLNFYSATTYAQDELFSNAQNTTASLSLSLANANGDIPTISTMINAVFDSGYYKQIQFNDMQGNELYSRIKEEDKARVPAWFLQLFDLEVQSANAHISSGWSPIGVLEVTPLAQSAHIKLYNNFLDLLKAFVIISVASFISLYLLLEFLLRSVSQLKSQAEAVANNDFTLTKEIPYTTEFKEVTLSMNKMVLKVKDIFDKEAQAVGNYHKLLYTDSLSGFGNRKYFDMELKNLIHAEDVNANGLLLNFFFDGINTANNFLGHEKVDKLIQEFAQIIEDEISIEAYAMKVRLDGSKFSIIFPLISCDEVTKIAENILKLSLERLKIYTLDRHEACNIKISLLKYRANNTVYDVVKKIEHSLSLTKANSVYSPSCSDVFDEADEDKDRKRLLKEALDKRNFSLALQAVYDEDNNIYHHEAYIRLMDEKGKLLPAGTFMPLVHEMNLDSQLDIEVIKYTISQINDYKEPISINISSRFIQDSTSLETLERLLNETKCILSFELSNHDIVKDLDNTLSFAKLIQSKGHILGIDKFSATNTNLNYLQALKPSFIKIDSHYLRDMLCQHSGVQNNALQILIDSLDSKIIATSIEDESIKEALNEVGIKYFQGSLLAKAKMM